MSRIVILVAARAATSLDPGTISAVRDAVEGRAPVVLSEDEAVEIPCAEAPAPEILRAAIGARPIDAVVTRTRGRRKGLLVADMDSTIVTGETLDDLAAQAGLGEAVAAITRRSMNGEIDFKAALRERVGMLKGLSLEALERSWAGVKLTGGARELVATMRAHHATTALVSGGFTWFTERVARLCGFDTHQANTLLDDGSALTGAVAEPILDRDAKREALLRLAALRGLRPSATMAVGDGANDLAMLAEAGLGVAFHAKPAVAAASAARIDFADLRGLLFLQGYSASMFRSE